MSLQPALLKAVPNVSEGRSREAIEAMIAAVRGVSSVDLLHVHTDEDHHRSVFTYVSESAAALRSATVALYAEALTRIDLRVQRGEHPRVGAVDVCPFVPLGTRSMEECVTLARETGAEVAERFGVPVYLYEEAATAPHRRELPEIRRGEFELFHEKIILDEWKPDFGPRQVHESAGVTVMGARTPLIAFNVQLGTENLDTAAAIARAVRGSSGGLRFVRAIPVHLHHRHIVQVSMNLLDFRRTPIHRAFELVRLEAERRGVSVISSEIVGLVPVEALTETAAWYLRVEGFTKSLLLEQRIADATDGNAKKLKG